MAETRIRINGLRELRADLKAIDKTLPRELNKALKRDAGPVRDTAKRLAPKRTGATAASIKVGTRGAKIVVYSRRDGAGIIHSGGRHPLFGNRNYWYKQKPTYFLTRAIDIEAPHIVRDVEQTVDRIMRSAGFK